MINNEDEFWRWFEEDLSWVNRLGYKTKSTGFALKKLDEGYIWQAKNSSGYWVESDMYFDTPHDALIDFFSNLICCEVVERE
jgi:hypothetical protein